MGALDRYCVVPVCRIPWALGKTGVFPQCVYKEGTRQGKQETWRCCLGAFEVLYCRLIVGTALVPRGGADSAGASY